MSFNTIKLMLKLNPQKSPESAFVLYRMLSNLTIRHLAICSDNIWYISYLLKILQRTHLDFFFLRINITQGVHANQILTHFNLMQHLMP